MRRVTLSIFTAVAWIFIAGAAISTPAALAPAAAAKQPAAVSEAAALAAPGSGKPRYCLICGQTHTGRCRYAVK